MCPQYLIISKRALNNLASLRAHGLAHASAAINSPSPPPFHALSCAWEFEITVKLLTNCFLGRAG